MSRKIFTGGLIVVTFLGMGILTLPTYAQEPGDRLSVVERLAERFDLNTEDVQQVFDEVHEERQADMAARMNERLSEAVSGGTITAAQKELILQKHSEMHVRMEALRDLDPEARREEMRVMHEEMRTWMEENDLNGAGFNMMHANGGHHMGMNKGMHR